MTESVAEPKGRVLVIDDDRMVGRMLVSHIKAAGYEANVTDDPAEFIELVQQWKPTHVFIDLVMGETDGLDVLASLAAVHYEEAVIIQSGMGGRVLDAARQYAQAHGLAFTGLLSKPFTRAAVAAVLEKTPSAAEAPAETIDMLSGWSAHQFEDELRAAATNGSLGVAFQPKVSCAGGRVVGFEALARWTHPELGPVPPMAYVPRAESLGLIDLVTDSVAHNALEWFASIRRQHQDRLSINVSAVELAQRALDTRLMAACAQAEVATERIILEVTETAAISDQAVSLEILTRLRLDGFHLSIDDFGTGYSSMVQLANMPFSEVKVDRSFVHHLGESLPAEVMVRSMLQLARGLGLECTAEGVETPLALEVLSRMGCDFAQGYYIARPMPAADLEDWLKTA